MSHWEPSHAPSDPLERLGLRRSLDRVAGSLGAGRSDVLRAVFAGWEAAVGASVAAHAKPVTLRNGALVVAVDHPTWATQLRFLESDLLARLAEAAGEGAVTRIEVRVNRS